MPPPVTTCVPFCGQASQSEPGIVNSKKRTASYSAQVSADTRKCRQRWHALLRRFASSLKAGTDIDELSAHVRRPVSASPVWRDNSKALEDSAAWSVETRGGVVGEEDHVTVRQYPVAAWAHSIPAPASENREQPIPRRLQAIANQCAREAFAAEYSRYMSVCKVVCRCVL